MSIYSKWENENKEIIGEKLMPTINSLGKETFISIYLLKCDYEDSYLIVGEDDGEYARFDIGIFTRDEVKRIFQSMDGKCLHWYIHEEDVLQCCMKYCINCDKLYDCENNYDIDYVKGCLEKRINEEMV